MNDRLDANKINSLGQLYLRKFGDRDWWWPMYDIDVETGLLRIDVMNRLECWNFAEVAMVRDDSGKEYEPEYFYTENHPDRAAARAPSTTTWRTENAEETQ
jgi:hypothetical protein